MLCIYTLMCTLLCTHTHNHFQNSHVSYSEHIQIQSDLYLQRIQKMVSNKYISFEFVFFCFISRRSALKESPMLYIVCCMVTYRYSVQCISLHRREIKHKNFIPCSTIYFYIGFDWFFNVPIRWCYIEMDVIIRTDIMYDDVLFLNANRHVSKSCSKFRFLLILCLEYDQEHTCHVILYYIENENTSLDMSIGYVLIDIYGHVYTM